MRILYSTFFLCFFSCLKIIAQPCGVKQVMSSPQQALIAPILNALDTALKYEDLYHIDSLSTALKNAYASQAGIPDAIEANPTISTNINWVNLSDAITLSRSLIDKDVAIYSTLWKVGKGMTPPSYQPHSIFLRSSAEIAVGLLKIADNETDLNRKTLYQSWATRALDSLATMQIKTGSCAGAFPFPDLRTYNDPTFTPIIKKFLLKCGDDSVNVLQNGWIIDDKGTGEFKFDAGVIANAYYEAFLYTGINAYKDIAISIGDYLKPLKFNLNYNYNSFVSLGLTRAYQLTNDMTYLDRAIDNLRYAVLPGQITNGRWVDGHNANSRYHSILIQNTVPTIPLIPIVNTYKSDLDSMCYKSIKNMVDYTNRCGATTGYRWLLNAYEFNTTLIPSTLKDSITDRIGRQINQSKINYKYLDIPTMGQYLELLSIPTSINETHQQAVSEMTLFPNPTNDNSVLLFNVLVTDDLSLLITDALGKLKERIYLGEKAPGMHRIQLDFSTYQKGNYFLTITSKKQISTVPFVKMD